MADNLVLSLARLADPEAPLPGEFKPSEREVLLALARPHGVANILWRKFGSGLDAPGGRETLHRLGQSMLLDGLRREIMAAFADGGISTCIVKGPVFAERLYAVRSDRLFSDIDLLVDPALLEQAIGIMERIGYARHGKVWDNSRRDMEYKFLHPEHPTVLIELHGNLVHYPLLRRRASFGLRELLAAGDGDGEAPTALLATAIVHATLGHKIDRLQMLVDVLQATRRLRREDFADAVVSLTRLRLGLESAVCLSVVARLFDDEAAAELARLCRRTIFGRLGSLLISPEAVLHAPTRGWRNTSWSRRKAFRLVQYLPGS